MEREVTSERAAQARAAGPERRGPLEAGEVDGEAP
jgi:hypothetical protein